MCWTNSRRMLITCCAAAVLLAAPCRSWAECALWDWMFGHGQTTYAPPYAPPNVCAPTPGACGCAPAQCAPVRPACQPCTPCAPTATYRISYRPVPTVAYMPVVGIDPCSGCAVTTYHPTRAWTYQASLQPYPTYRVGYVPATVGVGACGSCGGCAPCSGYATSCGGCSTCGTNYSGCSTCGTNYGGCSTCGTSYTGCSACNAGVSSGYAPSGGCSSCATSPAPLSGTPLPGPSDMSQPPATYSPSTVSSAPVTIGPPAAAPMSPGALPERARTYAPDATPAPIPPGVPAAPAPSGTSYRVPTSGEAIRTVEPPRIEDVPPVPGPQLSPTPNLRPENENRTTARPVLQAMYFQLLQSPPASVPAQTISAPLRAAPQPVDDSGWKHVDN